MTPSPNCQLYFPGSVQVTSRAETQPPSEINKEVNGTRRLPLISLNLVSLLHRALVCFLCLCTSSGTLLYLSSVKAFLAVSRHTTSWRHSHEELLMTIYALPWCHIYIRIEIIFFLSLHRFVRHIIKSCFKVKPIMECVFTYSICSTNVSCIGYRWYHCHLVPLGSPIQSSEYPLCDVFFVVSLCNCSFPANFF